MPHKLTAHCRATGIGSLPHHDPLAATADIISRFRQIPFWAQLPRRSLHEDMILMFSQHMPGTAIRNDRLWVDTLGSFDKQVEHFYQDYMRDDPSLFAVNRMYAEGLYALLEERENLPPDIYAVKGHLTGPFSFGMTVTDQDRKPIVYNEILRDILEKNLIMSARWQAGRLRELSPRVILYLDEPYLSAFGSSIFPFSHDEVTESLNTLFGAVNVVWGVHCCGNTDWSLLMDTKVDILSLDAYQCAINLALYTESVQKFLDRGGIISWGIVPTFEDRMDHETVESLESRLEVALNMLSAKLIDREQLLSQSLITPSCGLGLQTMERTLKVLDAVVALSERMREKYGLE